jgi:hypothetical protein
VHVVVSAMQKPEPVLGAFKSYSTRALRRAGLIFTNRKTLGETRKHCLSLGRNGTWLRVSSMSCSGREMSCLGWRTNIATGDRYAPP